MKLARLAVAIVSWWLITAGGLILLAQAWLMLLADGVAKVSPGQALTLPLTVLRNPLNPAAAFSPYASVLQVPMTASLVLGLALFAWITLMRHGYANPINALRSEYELPLSRHLKPKLRDLGIWVAHDAARNDPKAEPQDKLLVGLVRKLRPNADLARAVTRRTNGILVPYQGPQPAARILLGHYRHLHLVRRKKYNVYARPEQHVVIFGPSGAGKGATQMVPSLLFWNGEAEGTPDGHGAGWPGSIITSTVKSDHVDAALEWRQAISNECYIYDPLQSYPEYRDYWVGWDPLVTIRNFSDANAVAAALMESESQQAGGGGGNEEYFKAQALMVLSPMLLSAALKALPFRSVYDWALKLENEAADPNVISPEGDVAPDSRTYAVMDPLYDYAETTGDDTPLNQMQQIFAKDPREASGVWGTIRKILQPYNDEKSVLSTDPAHMPRMLNPKTFYSTPHATLFIIAPEVANEAKRMRPVFAAFITWLIEEAQKLARENNGKLPRPVLANLDEVKNVGAIPGLAHTLSLTRSIGFFVKHAWQDEAQIASAYGKDDAKTITSNSRTWVILPGISDPEHLDALARLIGERPVKKRKIKVDPNNPDDNSKMRAATASMVKELKDNELLILTDNLPPFVINATRYFQDSIMLRRHKLGDARRAGEPIAAPHKAANPESAPGQRTDTLPALYGPTLQTSVQAQHEGNLVGKNSHAQATNLPVLPSTGQPLITPPTPAIYPPAAPDQGAQPDAYAGGQYQATYRPDAEEHPGTDESIGEVGVGPLSAAAPPKDPTPLKATEPASNWPGAHRWEDEARGLRSHPAPRPSPDDMPAPLPPAQAEQRVGQADIGGGEPKNNNGTPEALAELFGAAPLPKESIPSKEQQPRAAPAEQPAPDARNEETSGAEKNERSGSVENTSARPESTPVSNLNERSNEAPETLGNLFADSAVARSSERLSGDSGEETDTTAQRDACPDCGASFALDGLDEQQRQAVWARHRKGRHPKQDRKATTGAAANDTPSPFGAGWQSPQT